MQTLTNSREPEFRLQDTTKISLRHQRDSTKAPPRHHRDTTDRDTTKTPPRDHQDTTEAPVQDPFARIFVENRL